MANLPYPSELEERIDLPNVGPAIVRPVRPGDEPAFRASFAKLTPHDIRMRFFAPLKQLPEDMLFDLTHIDYDRQMAFVMMRQKEKDLVGVSRLVISPDGEKAELAVIVRSDMKGRGIGRHLIKRIVDYARARNVTRLHGDILRENIAMTDFMRGLGFRLTDIPESEAIVRATCELRAQ